MNETVLEILTEETSMAYFLEGLLPRILPGDYCLGVNCFVRPHEGKSHLKKSLPKKIGAYSRFPYPVKLIIVHDQDSGDCLLLKNQLVNLCEFNSNIQFKVRIVCRELENWYFGDIQAIRKVYPEINSRKLAGKTKADKIDSFHGAYELERMTKSFSKTYAAREIAQIISIDSNHSPSYNQFLKGLRQLIQ